MSKKATTKAMASLDRLEQPPSHFATKSYAQLAQDVMINSFMRAKAGGAPGFYLDIGAYHPFRISNTYLFYELGWSGVCMDPNPATEAAFHRGRPRDVFVRSAIGAEDGVLDYYVFSAATQNTCDPEVGRERAKKAGKNFHGILKTPVRTVDSVLDEHAQGRPLDFVSIDVEGMEEQVFAGFDLARWSPRVIVYESHQRPVRHLGSKLYKRCHEAGYHLAIHTSRDAFYVRR